MRNYEMTGQHTFYYFHNDGCVPEWVDLFKESDIPISFKEIAPKVGRQCDHTSSLSSPMLSCYMPQAMAVPIMASPRNKDTSDIGIVVAVMMPHHEVIPQSDQTIPWTLVQTLSRVTVDACCSSAVLQLSNRWTPVHDDLLAFGGSSPHIRVWYTSLHSKLMMPMSILPSLNPALAAVNE
jgi:hypothetical protein